MTDKENRGYQFTNTTHAFLLLTLIRIVETTFVLKLKKYYM